MLSDIVAATADCHGIELWPCAVPCAAGWYHVRAVGEHAGVDGTSHIISREEGRRKNSSPASEPFVIECAEWDQTSLCQPRRSGT